MSNAEIFWLCVGFGAQAIFTARFLVQWLASEKKGESVIPLAFWYLSIAGGWMLLAYACYRRDPVIITGQLFGVIVYTRNLVLIQRKRAAESRASAAEPAGPAEPGEILPMSRTSFRQAG